MRVDIQWMSEVDQMADPQDQNKTNPKRFIGTLCGTIGPFRSAQEVATALEAIEQHVPQWVNVKVKP